jgi:hypothetical protein
MDDYEGKIRQFLEENEIETFKFGKTHRHRDLVVELGGKSARIVFPSTGSDFRGPMNTLRDLRGELRNIGWAPKPRQSQKAVKKYRPKQITGASGTWLSRVDAEHDAAKMPDRWISRLAMLKDMLAKRAENNRTKKLCRNKGEKQEARIRLRTPWLGNRQRYALI